MKKLFFVITLLFASSSMADSRYDNSLYGLSESEKSVMENRALALENQKTLRMHRLKFGQIQEGLEGLRSVVDSLGDKIGRTSQKISSQVDNDKITLLQSQIDELRENNEEKYNQIDAMLKKLTQMIGGISSSSSSANQTFNDDTLEVEEKPVKKILSNSDRFKKAVRLYRGKRFSEAKKDFEALADKNYKPAKMNYYLGEVSYYTKQYSDAIVYYKKSVGYYDSASYMPTLLLHTALSFEKLGDGDNASKFFDTIISTYPDSEQAKIAQKHLY